MPVSPDLNRLHIVLVRTRNPLNIGAAARAISNFGFSSLRVVKPYEKAFREARSAVGASSVLQNAEEHSTVADAVADCSLVVGTTSARDRELQHPLKRLQEASPIIREHFSSGHVAVLFGSEKTGLSNRDLSYCHWLLRIPTLEQHGSMNLGQAVAVCLYELIRQNDGKIQRKTRRQTNSAELDRIATSLLEILRISGYIAPGSGHSAAERIRRLVYRLQIPGDDAKIWLGILRQMLWKLKS